MKQEFLYRTRRLPTLGSTILVATLWFAPGVGVWQKTVTTILGSILGVLLGRASWHQVRRRIYAGNRVTLYYTDTLLYALLVGVGLASFSPGTALRGITSVAGYPVILFGAILGIASVGFGFSVAMYVEIRRYEVLRGPLRTKTRYAQSTTGAEGMLGKCGVVQTDCAPEGTVRVHGELWRARALDPMPIHVGEAVLIRELEGLCLLVERLKSGSA